MSMTSNTDRFAAWRVALGISIVLWAILIALDIFAAEQLATVF
ncbi:MAG: hypothetical protein ACXVRJ_08310 [Gaiellaceae bacterium]